MSTTENLLDRLSNVRKRGDNAWTATCPAHEDRTPSLSISAAEHRLLVHCWSGCSSLEIVNAIGLNLSDLFTDRLTNTSMPHVRQAPFPAERMREMIHCALVVGLAAGDLKHGKKLSDADQESLLAAIGKLTSLAVPVEHWPHGGEG